MAIRIIMQKLTLSLFFLFLAACAKNLEERAERGDVEAQYKLARQYQDSAQGDGYYDPADMQCAIRWYELAAEQGHAKAQCNLAYIYESGLSVPVDSLRAIELYKESASQGYAPAQWSLAVAYYNGDGIDQDRTKAYPFICLLYTSPSPRDCS